MEKQLDMRRRQYFDLLDFIWQIAISQAETVKPDEIRHKLLDLVAVHEGEREAALNATIRRLEQGIAA